MDSVREIDAQVQGVGFVCGLLLSKSPSRGEILKDTREYVRRLNVMVSQGEVEAEYVEAIKDMLKSMFREKLDV